MKNYTLQELQPLILEWANDKDLLKSENAPKQRLKLLEEVGETAGAILKNKTDEVKDGIGDIFVVLVILFNQESEDLYFEFNDDNLNNTLDYVFNAVLDFSSKNGMNGYALEWLNFIAERTSNNLTECANLAWNEIKDRTGKNVDGTFIKD